MTRLKELRKSVPKWITTSLFDIIVEMDPSDTNKFVPMIVSIVQNEQKQMLDSNWANTDDRKYFMEDIPKLLPPNYLHAEFEEVFPIWKLLDSQAFSTEIFNHIQEFMDLYMKKYITGTDVSQIKTIDELTTLVTLASIKQNFKEFEKQIHKVYEDDSWIILRPISYESSLKYGAGTRWCTASKRHPEHFFRYAKEGILIYCINKMTGYKVAVYKNIYERELSFWNSTDYRIDSMETDLDMNILKVLKDEIRKEDAIPNRDLDINIFDESYDTNSPKIKQYEIVEVGNEYPEAQLDYEEDIVNVS